MPDFRSTLLFFIPTLALLVTGCASTFQAERQIDFQPVKVPETDLEKRSVQASPQVTIDGRDYFTDFHSILRSGDALNGVVFGQLNDHLGQPILDKDGKPVISNRNDFSSLLEIDGELMMVSQFEDTPGAYYLTRLNQNPVSGELTATATRSLDTSKVRGGWVHCAGSVTPWNTHLGSEEYEPDAARVDKRTGHFNDYYNMAQARYFGLEPQPLKVADTDDLDGDGDRTEWIDNPALADGAYHQLSPYFYGWIIEVRVNSFDDANLTKHYSMGRFSHELAYVMPNRKTAYLSDDGTNVALYRYEADRPGDLSQGELFVAKWHQRSGMGAGSANLEWISLGNASDTEIDALIEKGVAFDDIFEKAQSLADDTAQCPAGFSSINTSVGHECLKLRPGMEVAASRLETRRYAAMLGGTTEFRKMEGVTANIDGSVLYLGMSSIDKGMADGQSRYDLGGANDIRLPVNKCGAVYALDLNRNFVAKNIYSILEGKPLTEDAGAANNDAAYDSNGPYAKNSCDLNGIANPDNLTFIPGRATLIIGEDSGSGHQNDAMWAYDLKRKKLTRILTTPYGSETTSPYFYPDLNGWAYLMAVIQHPYGESDADKLKEPDEERAYTGYFGPLPAIK